ncbi:MAG TPA: SDR family NAD(P)-dependent oxidoreductase, partial [Sphingomonas sp.]|nr:SDR family NAD(P)-dependent oxidoreductase [Sphingomonas sp.]
MAAQDQHPIGSGFGGKTTAQEIVGDRDLTGRNYIVTGGASGIGLETVRALAGAGGHVTVPVRDRAKAEAALADLPGQITIADMDLADIATVRRFAADYAAAGKPLHGLINNAGVMACPLARVGKAWEYQFAVCHLGHFALT